MNINLDNLVNLDMLLRGLGAAGRTMAAAAFGSAKTDPVVLERIAQAMYERHGAVWADANNVDRISWTDRAAAALTVIQEIVRGK